MISPRPAAVAGLPPALRRGRRSGRPRRYAVPHRMPRPLRESAPPAPSLLTLWLDDRRALPLKWGLLALALLGVALLEAPL
ncbi:MAG: hypothetical protein HY334_07100 [Armatimonadetes bacterium]|nr:hypothetical protein [Armatimonadota bacterium]